MVFVRVIRVSSFRQAPPPYFSGKFSGIKGFRTLLTSKIQFFQMRKISEESLAEANRLLSDLKESALPILVEGRNDEKALRRLGVEGDIRRIQESGPIAKTAEDLKKKGIKAAIILTGPDNEGVKIARLIASALEAFGMHPEMRYRKMTKLFGKTAVEQLGKGAKEEDFA